MDFIKIIDYKKKTDEIKSLEKEVTELEKEFKSIKNYYVDYQVNGHELIMHYKVKSGSIGNSYGVNLLRALGFSKEILDNAYKMSEEHKN